MKYVNDKNVHTYILKKNADFVGFFELIYHQSKKEIEIAYFGILPEYFENGFGGFMLTEAIKCSFSFNVNRVWVHTCSLDHSNALKNYLDEDELESLDINPRSRPENLVPADFIRCVNFLKKKI